MTREERHLFLLCPVLMVIRVIGFPELTETIFLQKRTPRQSWMALNSNFNKRRRRQIFKMSNKRQTTVVKKIDTEDANFANRLIRNLLPTLIFVTKHILVSTEKKTSTLKLLRSFGEFLQR